MYRRPKFLESLHDIRCEMAAEADYDVQLFVEMVRHEAPPPDASGPEADAAPGGAAAERLVTSQEA